MNTHLKTEAELKDFLKGMLFHRFCFETRFSLYFLAEKNKETEENGFPGAIRVFLSSWWFGDREDWEARTGGDWRIEEQLLSSELARLRWSGNPVVSDVKLLPDKISLVFETGGTIHSVEAPDGDEFFIRIDEVDGGTWFEASKNVPK